VIPNAADAALSMRAAASIAARISWPEARSYHVISSDHADRGDASREAPAASELEPRIGEEILFGCHVGQALAKPEPEEKEDEHACSHGSVLSQKPQNEGQP
jgi:hypothetical protein